jgi:hypothetical protein
MFDKHDVSGVGCTPVFRWLVIITLTFFVLVETVGIEPETFRKLPYMGLYIS